MTNERVRQPYMPKGQLETLVTKTVSMDPSLTFMVRDVVSIIDFELAKQDPTSTPPNKESVRRIMNEMVEAGELHSRTLEQGQDVPRYQARQHALRFYSLTNPVPTYTPVMVELFDEYPAPRMPRPVAQPRLSSSPLQTFVAATHTPTPAIPTYEPAARLHALVDQLVEDLTQPPSPTVDVSGLEQTIKELREDNDTLKLRNSELRAQLNRIKTAAGF